MADKYTEVQHIPDEQGGGTAEIQVFEIANPNLLYHIQDSYTNLRYYYPGGSWMVAHNDTHYAIVSEGFVEGVSFLSYIFDSHLLLDPTFGSVINPQLSVSNEATPTLVACLYTWDNNDGVTSEKCSVKVKTTGSIVLDDMSFAINSVVVNQLRDHPRISYKGQATLIPRPQYSDSQEKGVGYDFSMNYQNREAHAFTVDTPFYNVEMSTRNDQLNLNSLGK